MKEKISFKEKKFDFKNLFKNFVKPEQLNIDEQELIMKEDLPEKNKTLLINSLNRGDKLASRLFREDLKEKAKGILTKKMESLKVDTDGKVSEDKKVNKKNKEEKIQEN